MDDESLRRTLATGRTWFWSRSRQELLAQGRDLGRPPVRPGGPATTATATPWWSWSTSTATAPATPASGSCFYRTVAAGPGRIRPEPPRPSRPVTGADASPGRCPAAPGLGCDPTRRRVRRAGPGATGSSRCGASWWPTPSPRWPPSSRRRRGRPGLPARVGRGRGALGPVLLRRPPAAGHAGGPGPAGVGQRAPSPVPGWATAACWPPSRRSSPPTGRRCSTTCRRSTAGWSATSATTSCGRWSACPTSRPTTSASPTPPSPSSASWPPSTTGASGSSSSTTWSIDAGLGRRPRRAARLRGRRPAPGRARRRLLRPPGGRRSSRPVPDEVSRRRRHPHLSERAVPAAVEVAKEHIRGRRHLPGGAVAAVRPRARGRPVRGLPGAAPGQPEPLPVLPALPRACTVVGSSPEPMVRLRDGVVTSRPIAGTRPPGRDRRGGPPAGRPS